MSKRILVTGSSGFVGQHVVPTLIARGYEVTVASRQVPETVLKATRVLPIGDLRNEIDWNRHLEGMDAVVHLAALAHITSDIPESIYDQINNRAAVRLAKAARTNKVKLVFASSVAAQCGPSAERVICENDKPFPTTAYGRSKLRAEQGIREVSSDFVIFRPTLIYGDGVIGNMQRLLRLAMTRIPPPFKLIKNRRSLLAVENMCDAICFAISSRSASNKTFLLADREPISTSDLVAHLRLGAGLGARQTPVPPVVLQAMLRLLGRGDVWEKIAGNLVVSVAELEKLGFIWRAETRDRLRALGKSSILNSARQRSKSTSPAVPPPIFKI